MEKKTRHKERGEKGLDDEKKEERKREERI